MFEIYFNIYKKSKMQKRENLTLRFEKNNLQQEFKNITLSQKLKSIYFK